MLAGRNSKPFALIRVTAIDFMNKEVMITMDDRYDAYLKEHGLTADTYNNMERLVVAVSREIPNKSFAFVGTGLPIMAANLAKRMRSPEVYVVLEAGTIDPQMEHAPGSVSDPRASYKAAMLGTMADSFGAAASRGFCTFGVLGCAECDKYANLNSTCVGEYTCAAYSENGRGPKKRLIGSGGATDIAAYADKMIINTEHERRRFPDKVSYLTTVAGMRGPDGESRYARGLYRGGEVVVITDLCIMRPDPETGILYVTDIYEGVDPQQIQDNTGWDIDLSRAKVYPKPTYEELKQLRLYVDPNRLYLDKNKKKR